MQPIYLDYNATTPVDAAVADAMDRAARQVFGNPSSAHAFGREARDLVDRAREQVAALLGAAADEVVFTSGGSEANNLAIKGTAWARGKGHVISQVTEHPSVLEPLRFLERAGFRVTYLPVDGRGLIDPEAARRAIAPDTFLITLQHANNETGAIQPLAAVSAIARERGVLVHSDAAQSAGKIPVQVDDLGVDLLTIAGHKLYAPKGAGALYARRGVRLEPLIHGAGHESGRRAGTEALHQMAALGEACRIALKYTALEHAAGDGPDSPAAGIRALRDRLHRLLREAIPGLALHGHPELRLPNTLNAGFPGVAGAELLEAAAAISPGIAASTGSACHEGETRLSPVLEAMGVPPATGRGAVRLSLGRPTTADEIVAAARILVAAWRKLGDHCR